MAINKKKYHTVNKHLDRYIYISIAYKHAADITSVCVPHFIGGHTILIKN